jgi:peptidoglycan/LPS O-acetylase OafA/YrhL
VTLKENEYRLDVDGLRAIAILFVVSVHAGVPLFSGGYTGVDIFFVISGYLIGGHIYRDLLRNEFSYLEFYRRRAKRILPPLIIVLIALLFSGLVLLDPTELRRLSEYIAATISSCSNLLYYFKTNYFTPSAHFNLLLMTWSLGVEEQFYFVIPVILVLFSRIRKDLVLPLVGLVTLISFVIAWHQVDTNPSIAFYLLPARAWELAVGVMLAILEVQEAHPLWHRSRAVANFLSLLGVILVFYPVAAYSQETQFPGPRALPSVLGAAFLIASKGSWVNCRLLSSPPFPFIGKISYSWYLWHWPLYAMLWTILGHEPSAYLRFLGASISLVLAVLTYYYIETPFRSSKTPAVPLLLRYGTVSVILLAASLAIYKVHGVESRYPVLKRVNQSESIYVHDPCIVINQTAPNLSSGCTASFVNGPKIAIWGDSHAAALAQGLRVRAAESGFALAEYEQTGCQPIIGVALYDPGNPRFNSDCIQFNDAVLRQLTSDEKVEIVALEAYWDHQFDRQQLLPRGATLSTQIDPQAEIKLMRDGIARTIQALRAAHKQVVIFGDVPVFEVNPVWRMHTSRIPARYRLYAALGGSEPVDPGFDYSYHNRRDAISTETLLHKIASAIPDVTYVDLKSAVCQGDAKCVYRNGDIAYYINSDHISREGGIVMLAGWNPIPASAR